LRIGFIDLVDAAPLIVAFEERYFADEGLSVVLERQLGWGNIRDRLTYGELDAAHALVGMPLFSRIARDWFMEPLVALMNLGSGGNAITLSRRLVDAGVRSAATLGEYIRSDPRGEVMSFGHVFSCSMHHYLLRDWLASGGIDPDADVRLRVFPPNQMAAHMAGGHLDGFCVGEPWNTLAQHQGAGGIVAMTTDILPAHPEKVLAVTQRWLEPNASLVVPMIRAILRGCAYCEDDRNHDALAQTLAAPSYLNAPPELIRRSLTLERRIAPGSSGAPRTSDWRARSFAAGCTFPSKTHFAWLVSQMQRWGQLTHAVNAVAVATRCADSAAYRAAAASLGLQRPASDFPPMTLRTGTFDPLAAAGDRQNERATEGATT
jgi:ABC-type nitrate/sulfonate/bicarbonate transport system substrate-binding protein